MKQMKTLLIHQKDKIKLRKKIERSPERITK